MVQFSGKDFNKTKSKYNNLNGIKNQVQYSYNN